MIRPHNLSEQSDSYYGQPEVYNLFSKAEDYPGKILTYLLSHVSRKKVLEIGPGTGKYVQHLAPRSLEYTCLDLSPVMLNHSAEAIGTEGNTKFVRGTADALPFASESFDVVVACWVLGTIPIERQRAAVAEAKRVAGANGKIILVENDYGGEFEEIRGRFPHCKRTQTYNQWLQDNMGFKRVASISTFFQFQDQKMAREVFGRIWTDTVGKRVRSHIIQHKVVIFQK